MAASPMRAPRHDTEYEKRAEVPVGQRAPIPFSIQRFLKVMGYLFLAVGFLGFILPGLFFAHLSPLHNLIHLSSGVLALWAASKLSTKDARVFSFIFGGLYGLLGVIGFIVGQPDLPSVPHMDIDNNLWRVITGSLEFGTADHIIHLLIGGAFIVAGVLAGRPARARITARTVPIDRI